MALSSSPRVERRDLRGQKCLELDPPSADSPSSVPFLDAAPLQGAKFYTPPWSLPTLVDCMR